MNKLILLCLLLGSKFCFAQQSDPTSPVNFADSLCIQSNTSIGIEIYYEFTPATGPSIQPEQKKFDYLCIIDDRGFITLPPFFESIQPDSNPYGKNLKIQVLNSTNPCGPNQCLTYDKIEKKLTDYFLKNIGVNPYLKQIQVKVSPQSLAHTNSMTVYFKRTGYNLPYAYKSINDYFSDPLIRKRIGLKCRKSKFEVFSVCSTTAPARRSSYGKFKEGITYNPRMYQLMPGDVIFLK